MVLRVSACRRRSEEEVIACGQGINLDDDDDVDIKSFFWGDKNV